MQETPICPYVAQSVTKPTSRLISETDHFTVHWGIRHATDPPLHSGRHRTHWTRCSPLECPKKKPASPASASPWRFWSITGAFPHIYAETEEDLFFAQGYNAARDRLFQLELWRRQVSGTLSELLGPRTLDKDIGARLLKYRGDLDQGAEPLPRARHGKSSRRSSAA